MQSVPCCRYNILLGFQEMMNNLQSMSADVDDAATSCKTNSDQSELFTDEDLRRIFGEVLPVRLFPEARPHVKT